MQLHGACNTQVACAILVLVGHLVIVNSARGNCRASFSLEIVLCESGGCNDEALQVSDVLTFSLYLRNLCTHSQDGHFVSATLKANSVIHAYLAIDEDYALFPHDVLTYTSYEPEPGTDTSFSVSSSGMTQCDDVSCGLISVHDSIVLGPDETIRIGKLTGVAVGMPTVSPHGALTMYSIAEIPRSGLEITDPTCRLAITGGASASTVSIFLPITVTTSPTRTRVTSTMTTTTSTITSITSSTSSTETTVTLTTTTATTSTTVTMTTTCQGFHWMPLVVRCGAETRTMYVDPEGKREMVFNDSVLADLLDGSEIFQLDLGDDTNAYLTHLSTGECLVGPEENCAFQCGDALSTMMPQSMLQAAAIIGLVVLLAAIALCCCVFFVGSRWKQKSAMHERNPCTFDAITPD